MKGSNQLPIANQTLKHDAPLATNQNAQLSIGHYIFGKYHLPQVQRLKFSK